MAGLVLIGALALWAVVVLGSYRQPFTGRREWYLS